MAPKPDLPAFRADIEVLAQPAPGNPARCVLRDPRSGEVVECTDKEVFLCRQLDGATSLPDVCARVRERFHVDLPLDNGWTTPLTPAR